MDVKKELDYRLYLPHDSSGKRVDADREFSFYRAIANGDLETVKRLRLQINQKGSPDSEQSEYGTLSKNPVQNAKFHFVVLAAMITRFCVEEGLNRELAYHMSDIYIQQADECTSVKQIEFLQNTMTTNFTEQMKKVQKKPYSLHITKCVDYIHENLDQKLTVDMIADYLKLSPSYLSKLFQKETDSSISSYIRDKKLEAAANMLKYSTYEIAEISEYFQFSSQSHFTTLFQEKYKLSPKKYRDANVFKYMPEQKKN